MIHDFANFDNASDGTAGESASTILCAVGARARVPPALIPHGLTNAQPHIMLSAQFVGATADQFSRNETTLTGDPHESKCP